MKPKQQKRAEAELRNAAWASLPPAIQLAHLDRAGNRALKQRAKIAKQLNERK